MSVVGRERKESVWMYTLPVYTQFIWDSCLLHQWLLHCHCHGPSLDLYFSAGFTVSPGALHQFVHTLWGPQPSSYISSCWFLKCLARWQHPTLLAVVMHHFWPRCWLGGTQPLFKAHRAGLSTTLMFSSVSQLVVLHYASSFIYHFPLRHQYQPNITQSA